MWPFFRWEQAGHYNRSLRKPVPAWSLAYMTLPENAFHTFLRRQTEGDWLGLLDQLIPSVHDVDRSATRIWFHFFPLELATALGAAPDPAPLVRKLVLMGRFRLRDQIDSSHAFLYGHRYWPTAKQVTLELARTGAAPADLTDLTRDIARRAAARVGVEPPLLAGIAAVGSMTLRQVGIEAFARSTGDGTLEPVTSSAPGRVLRARARDDSQGVFGFLRGIYKQWTITFDENERDARFTLIDGQTLTGAAANDKREYRSKDARCIPGEGPIPVQCRSAFCGTCWVGVLGGAEKLSDVEKLERERIREFGYIDTDEPKPIIRLACQAQASGAVSIVIPPWNGIVGRFLRAHRGG